MKAITNPRRSLSFSIMLAPSSDQLIKRKALKTSAYYHRGYRRANVITINLGLFSITLRNVAVIPRNNFP